MKKIFLGIISILIVLTFVACGNTASAKKELLGSGKTMSLRLPANPSTGYDWSYTLEEGENNGNIILNRQENDFPETNLMGAGGYRVYYFVGSEIGPVKLTFTYSRPWEGGEVAYDVVYDFNVNEDFDIEWYGKKKGVVESEQDLSFFPDPAFE